MCKKWLLLLCSFVSVPALAVSGWDSNSSRQVIEEEYQTENLTPKELRAYSVCLTGSLFSMDRVDFAQCVKNNLENGEEARRYLDKHLKPKKKETN